MNELIAGDFMALSTFDKKIIIKDPKAINLILDGLTCPADESKKPKYINIEEQMEKAGNIGSEFERMALVGSVVPDLWMKKATGAPVGPEALLNATKHALSEVVTDTKAEK